MYTDTREEVAQMKTKSKSKPIPPDNDEPGMNDQRSGWAEAALRAFIQECHCDPEDALSDLLCDLMHWADRNSSIEFDRHLARARRAYEGEACLHVVPQGQTNAE